jgi:hypothetical protein
MSTLEKWNPFRTTHPWDPMRDMEEIQNRLASLFGRRLPLRKEGAEEGFTLTEWSPPVDIAEDEKEYTIKAELPERARTCRSPRPRQSLQSDCAPVALRASEYRLRVRRKSPFGQPRTVQDPDRERAHRAVRSHSTRLPLPLSPQPAVGKRSGHRVPTENRPRYAASRTHRTLRRLLLAARPVQPGNRSGFAQPCPGELVISSMCQAPPALWAEENCGGGTLFDGTLKLRLPGLSGHKMPFVEKR